MAKTVLTGDGDLVDQVVWRETGSALVLAVERVLEANPDLARSPVVLPAGVAIVIPDDAAAPPARPTFKLWD